MISSALPAEVYSRRDDERAVSSDSSIFETGLRLRYEIRREFAPGIGIEWAGKYTEETRLVAGIHV